MPSGGSRPGSGRKSVRPEVKRVQLMVTISPETKVKLMELAKERNRRVGRVLDDLIQNAYYM